MKMIMTYAIAHAAGEDAANRNMRKGRRYKWNREDYTIAIKEMDRLLHYVEHPEKYFSPAELNA